MSSKPETPKEANVRLEDENSKLLQEVGALAAALHSLEKKLDDAVTVEQAQRFIEDNARIRKRVAFTIVASVLLAFFATLTVNNVAITRCFLTGAQRHSAICNTVFPGYNEAVDEGNDRLRKFNQLLKQIPLNVRKNKEQDDRLDRLEKKVGVK